MVIWPLNGYIIISLKLKANWNYIQNFGFLSDQNFHFFASKKWIAIFRIYIYIKAEQRIQTFRKFRKPEQWLIPGWAFSQAVFCNSYSGKASALFRNYQYKIKFQIFCVRNWEEKSEKSLLELIAIYRFQEKDCLQ